MASFSAFGPCSASNFPRIRTCQIRAPKRLGVRVPHQVSRNAMACASVGRAVPLSTFRLRDPCAPDVKKHHCDCDRHRPQDNTGRAKQRQTADQRNERWDGVEFETVSHQHRIQEVVDATDDQRTPRNEDYAFSQLPSSARKIAAGIQTMNAPKTGTTASRAMTRPQSSGVGRPSHQNINPPRVPCTPATTTVP